MINLPRLVGVGIVLALLATQAQTAALAHSARESQTELMKKRMQTLFPVFVLRVHKLAPDAAPVVHRFVNEHSHQLRPRAPLVHDLDLRLASLAHEERVLAVAEYRSLDAPKRSLVVKSHLLWFAAVLAHCEVPERALAH